MLDTSHIQEKEGAVPLPEDYRRWSYTTVGQVVELNFTGTFRQLEAAALGRFWIIKEGWRPA